MGGLLKKSVVSCVGRELQSEIRLYEYLQFIQLVQRIAFAAKPVLTSCAIIINSSR